MEGWARAGARERAREVKIRGSPSPAPAAERADGRAARSVPSRPLLHPLASRPGRLLARPLACILTPAHPLPCKPLAGCRQNGLAAASSPSGAEGEQASARRACTPHPRPRLHTRPCLQARASFAAASSHPGSRLTSSAARPIVCCPLLLQPGSSPLPSSASASSFASRPGPQRRAPPARDPPPPPPPSPPPPPPPRLRAAAHRARGSAAQPRSPRAAS